MVDIVLDGGNSGVVRCGICRYKLVFIDGGCIIEFGIEGYNVW